MANIDVSFLMDDPDFINTFEVTRYTETIDNNGRVVANTPGKQLIHGSVQAASGRTLRIMPEMSTVNGSIEIYTRFRLTTASDTTMADVVTWQGRKYEVVTVVPWTNWGAGHIRAVATMLNVLSPPPTPTVTTKGEDKDPPDNSLVLNDPQRDVLDGGRYV